MPTLDTNRQQRLSGFVREHDVCWRRLPLTTNALSSQPVQFGFVLELHAAHVRPNHPPQPGCDECSALHAGLAEIARAVLPLDRRATRHQVRVLHTMLAFATTQGGRLEVVVEIELTHRSGLGPVDDCERRCLTEIEKGLRELGARMI